MEAHKPLPQVRTLFEASFPDYEEVKVMFGANKNFSFDNFSIYVGGGLGFATIDGLDLTVFELNFR